MPVNPRWTPALLDGMRLQGDPPADETMNRLITERGIPAANAILLQLVRNAGALPGGTPPFLRDFLAATAALPAWADRDRIRRAQIFFTGQGPFFGLALMCKCLPTLYAGARGGAQLLYGTGQLTNHFRRRASETLRFILDAMEPGGLDPGGKGLRTIQKVRLMHASIRCYASRSTLFRDRPDWGVPINQEELAGTLISFSWLALEGLRRLDVDYDSRDDEDYLHAWKAIGACLGIREELLPRDCADARALWRILDRRNFAPTPEGRALAADHLKFLQELIHGDLLDGLPRDLMHFLMGDRIAHRILGLPRPGWTHFLIKLLSLVLQFQARIALSGPRMRRLTALAGQALMETLHNRWSEGYGAPFKIPETLRPP